MTKVRNIFEALIHMSCEVDIFTDISFPNEVQTEKDFTQYTCNKDFEISNKESRGDWHTLN